MVRQMLLYERVVPLSPARHGRWSIAPLEDLGFAAGVNSLPLMVSEFAAAAVEYPIVFVVDDRGATPMVVLGFRANRNALVDGAGRWRGRYLPAFLRRYPFVFSASPDGRTLTLCIDESHRGFDAKGRRGERLFDDAGNRTAALERALAFTRTFQDEHDRTRRFGAMLKDAGLLGPASARAAGPEGAAASLAGFHCVDRAKLKALDGERLAALMAADALELAHLHLLSLRNFDRLAEFTATDDRSRGDAHAAPPAAH